jgi:UDP-N-acetylmuramyl pentapeptide phosphotransferase/UDP-N-acetylglucosamine-1-phosphate transferase
LVFARLAPKPLADLGQIAAALGFAGALGLVGGLDDLYDFGAKPKLLIQTLLSIAFAAYVARIEAIPLTAATSLPLGPVVGVLGTALWLVVTTNAVNFMDGANGLAAGSLAIALLALAAAGFAGGAPGLGGAALMAAVAGLGFLPWNFPKARLFQGDAGALFSSSVLGALAVIGAHASGRGPVFVLFAPVALLPFLADVLLTLLSRARAHKALLAAHSEHLYQRWLACHGGSHVKLAWRTYGLMGAFAGFGLSLTRAGPTAQLFGFVAATAAMVGLWIVLRRQVSR